MLHDWSVGDIEGFWAAAAEFLGVDPLLARSDARFAGHAGHQWFPGGTLNYAEHALRDGPGRAEDAVVFVREDGLQELVSHGELRALVAACARACNASA